MQFKRISTSTALILLVTSGLILILVGWGLGVGARISAVDRAWIDYNARAAASYAAFSDVSRHLGYGGFIHDFKNYVLRRDEKYAEKIDRDLIGLFAAMERLDSLLSEPDERAALARLRATVLEYRDKYTVARRMVAAGADPAAIDKVVKVDDSPALEARAILLRRIVERGDSARVSSAHALEAAENFLHLGALILIPVFAVAWLTHNFTRRIESSGNEAKVAREQTELLLETAPDPMLAVDSGGRIRRANSMAVGYFGYPRETLLGMKVDALLPERYRKEHDALRSVFLQSPTHSPMERDRGKISLAGGDERDVAVSLSRFNVGEETFTTVALRDITEQRIAEEELHLAASVFDNSAESLMVTDASGIIISVNPAFTVLTGYSAAEALGQNPSLIRSDRHGPEFYKSMWQVLLKDGLWRGEIWNRKKSGEAYLEWRTIKRIDDNEGNPVRYVSVSHDITELRRKDEKIHHLAFHDALTGMPNRALLQERLEHGLERASREGTGLVVMFLDLDRFKAVNDTLGHAVGDMLLQDVARRIKGRLRVSDTLARLGGDEFVVLMEEVNDPAVCSCLAEEIITVVGQPMELSGHTVQVGTSVGIASFPKDGEDVQELMKNADTAMYAAKSAGRNTYRIFQREMLERAATAQANAV